MENKVLLYNGEGVSLRSFHYLYSTIAHYCPNFSIQPIDAEGFSQSDWEKSAVLVIFPGGRDLPYQQALSGERNKRIRDYVKAGGKYMGICAGGYYGASLIEFEKGGELEVCEKRELGFYPGKAIGPAYGKGLFCYQSEKGARSAQILWDQGEAHVYFNGGCYFEGAEQFPDVEVLARYGDLPGSFAAAVHCHFGSGRALLSGVHPEFSYTNPFCAYLIHQILK